MSGGMAAPSSAIDIVGSGQRHTSSSPRSQSSNLTTALQQAAKSTSRVAVESPMSNGDDNRLPLGRQDSNGFNVDHSVSEARPIAMGGKARKESNAGSFMGAMSFGGVSVGSLLQDDIMMTGTSPYNMQSPSFHSSSYLPKLEANFWNNLRCCDTSFKDLHELYQHFEDVHAQAPSTFPHRMSGPGTGRGFRRKSSNSQMEPMRAANQIRGFQPAMDFRQQLPNTARQISGEGARKPSLSTVQDMETIGDMELDDIPNGQTSHKPPLLPPSSMDAGLASPFQDDSSLLTPKPPSNVILPRSSNPVVPTISTTSLGTPQATRFPSDVRNGDLQKTPTTAGNTDTFTRTGTTERSRNSALFASLSNEFNNLDFNSTQLPAQSGPLQASSTVNGGEMLDLCINDPAKALFSNQGNIDTQQYPQFGFINGSAARPNVDGEDAVGQLVPAQQLAANRIKLGLPPDGEDRPFKCPVIGCEKAYKNANGLRYHEKHGHNTQQLKENSDGTYSIVDPVTSQPYPGTVGMEKEKPYRCEVCGKRYKNLNGLKYHRNHSPPCNPEFHFNNVSLPDMGPTGSGVDGIDGGVLDEFGSGIGEEELL